MSIPDSKGWHLREGDPPGVQRWYDGRKWTNNINGGQAMAALSRARAELAAIPRPTPQQQQIVLQLEAEVHGIANINGLILQPSMTVHHPAAAATQPFTGYQTYAPQQVAVQAPADIASMGARLGARIVDAIIEAFGFWLLVTIIGAVFGNGGFGAFLELLVFFAAFFGYQAYLVGTTGQTPGRKLSGIRVVDANGGGPIGFGRALGRELLLGITGAFCMVGYFSPFFDGARRNQGWHDKACDDYVING